jgi:Family of unknown function (DUF6134)
MKLAAAVVVLVLFGTGAQASTETTRFAITRNGEQIGMHLIEVNRSGQEISVAVVTDLTVKVLFVTAYRLQLTASERWVNGSLVALNSRSDNNGTRHFVSVSAKGSSLEVKVDGKATLIDANIMPASFWNPELLGRPIMLDAQDGQVMPVSVRDGGEEELTINGRIVKAHRYTINSRYSQDVWYDDQARLVQAKLIASDGSVIMYRPL